MGATPVAVGGGGGKVSGAANLVYATPNGSSGAASLRALVAADIPNGTDAATFEIDANETSRWRLSRASAYDFDVEHFDGSNWAITHRTSDYGSNFIFHSFLGLGSFSYNAGTTDDAQNVLTLTANKAGGTPLTGFGTSFTLQAESSTTEYASLARIASTWTDPTHATRTSKLSLYVMQAGSEVEGAYIDGTGLHASALTLTGNQIANYVFASPNGSAGAPSFRALVAGDIPALSYVTSVAASVPSWLSVSGSPITSSGTLAITADASQTQNMVLATPNGSTGALSVRSLVAADIPTLPNTQISGLGTMSTQNANSVAITGGSFNGTVGATTPNTGAFTTISASTSLSVTAGTAATVASTINGAVSQSANLMEWKNSSGTVLAAVTPTLGIQVGSGTGVSVVCSGTNIQLRANGSTIFNAAGDNLSIGALQHDFHSGSRTLRANTTNLYNLGEDSYRWKFFYTNTTTSILTDAGTTTVPTVVTVGHTSSSTPTAGFGASLIFSLHSSTTIGQQSSRIASLWNVATHASRAADLIGYASDANAEREIWRGRANGSAGAIGFLGATPAIRQTVANPYQAIAALATFGLTTGTITSSTKTGNYTATASDNLIKCDASSGGFTITLPAASTVSGLSLDVIKIDATGNLVVIAANGAETISGSNTWVIGTQWTNLTLRCDGTAWYII